MTIFFEKDYIEFPFRVQLYRTKNHVISISMINGKLDPDYDNEICLTYPTNEGFCNRYINVAYVRRLLKYLIHVGTKIHYNKYRITNCIKKNFTEHRYYILPKHGEGTKLRNQKLLLVKTEKHIPKAMVLFSNGWRQVNISFEQFKLEPLTHSNGYEKYGYFLCYGDIFEGKFE
jgi:hypothetical protein